MMTRKERKDWLRSERSLWVMNNLDLWNKYQRYIAGKPGRTLDSFIIRYAGQIDAIRRRAER